MKQLFIACIILLIATVTICRSDENKKINNFEIDNFKLELQEAIDRSRKQFTKNTTREEFINLQIDTLIKLQKLTKDLEKIINKNNEDDIFTPNYYPYKFNFDLEAFQTDLEFNNRL